MSTFIWFILFASAFVGGAVVDKRIEDGLPVVPKLSGFTPNNFLPQGVEQQYQYDESAQEFDPDVDVTTAYDPHADEQVVAWLSEHEGTGGYAQPYAPETLEFQSNPPSNQDRIDNENSTLQRSELVESPVESSIFNSLEPESVGEFELYEDLVSEGLAPKGNEILVKIWNVKPGNSESYRKARVRRNEFADRLT